MQLLVELTNWHVFDVADREVSCAAIKNELSQEENIPADEIGLRLDGAEIDEFFVFSAQAEAVVVRAYVRKGILGGKGGFGAMLRSLAKQRGAHQTTDFGACRDLSGRRLRHVNDEIILNRWKESKEKGEEFDVEEETMSGISMWYLSTPSWADGVKVDHRKNFMKPRLKTSLCLDWVRAREQKTRPLPPGVPSYWGCPRGRRCEFAHGEHELRGGMKLSIQEERARAEREAHDRKKQDYMAPLYRAGAREDDDVMDLVMAGLNAAKKAAQQKEENSLWNTDRSTREAGHDIALIKEGGEVAAEERELQVVRAVIDVDQQALFRIVGGSFIFYGPPGNRIESDSNFATLAVDGCSLSQEGAWYYEVEILTDGLMQMGWANSEFSCDADQGDGVGDDAHSWGYDGLRRKRWHAGEFTEYGPQLDTAWQADDVVGVYLQITSASSASDEATATTIAAGAAAVASAPSKGKGKRLGSTKKSAPTPDQVQQTTKDLVARISFSVNGIHYGEAFQFPIKPSKRGFFPAISLERKESVEVNIGQAPFRYPPNAAIPSASVFVDADDNDPAEGKSSSSSSKSSSSSNSSGAGQSRESEDGSRKGDGVGGHGSVDSRERTRTGRKSRKHKRAATDADVEEEGEGGKEYGCETISSGDKGTSARGTDTAAAGYKKRNDGTTEESSSTNTEVLVTESAAAVKVLAAPFLEVEYIPVISALSEEAAARIRSGKILPKLSSAVGAVGAAPAINEDHSNSSKNIQSINTATSNVSLDLDSAGSIAGITERARSTPAVGEGPSPSVEPVSFAPVDLEAEAEEGQQRFADASALAALGLSHLKHELERRGLKAGGTLQERAERLFSVKGLRPDQIDKKLLKKRAN